uniref:EGF-like domain-containing protein n=1 Tax=Parascaris equorum TaxID=6256 RepID=A0A914RQ25_PAREQ
MTFDKGMQCYCPPGQEPRGNECEDEDECKRVEFGGVPVCAQICVNLIAKRAGDQRYRCACAPEFELVNETWCRTLKASTPSTQASVFLYGQLRIVHKKLDNLKDRYLDSINVPELQALAVDHRRRRLCWVAARAVNTLDQVSCVVINDNGQFVMPIRNIDPVFTVEGMFNRRSPDQR